MKKQTRPKIPPKKLRDIWDKVPKMVDCKGLCHDSCGPIPVASLERKLVEERAGKELRPTGPSLTCSLLTKDGLCSVYAIRPLICRIWGASQGVPCSHGCKSERTLTMEESMALFEEVEEVAGDSADQAMEDMLASMDPVQRIQWRADAGAAVKKVLDSAAGERPGLRALMGEFDGA